jgi:hypothetical protein
MIEIHATCTSKNFQFSQGKIALLWDFLYIFAAELAI